MTSRYERFYAVIRRIPAGRVATYGEVATLAGFPGHARQVGYALYALREGTAVPWHRVVNARGRLSLGRVIPEGDVEQRIRLEIEGVEFDADGKIDLRRYRWQSRKRSRRRPPKQITGSTMPQRMSERIAESPAPRRAPKRVACSTAPRRTPRKIP